MKIIKSFSIAIVCVILLVIFPSTHEASCENKVRLADLQGIIKNQMRLIEEQRRVNEEQRETNEALKTVVRDEKSSISNLTMLNEDLNKRMEYLTTGKMWIYSNEKYLI